MSFLWSPTKAPDAASVDTNKREFDDLLASKDLELQAILEGGSVEAPAASGPEDSKIPAASGARRSAARPSASAAAAAAPTAGDAKLNPELKMWFGVPRNYVLLVLIVMFMGIIVSQYMGAIWNETEVNEKTISEADLTPKSS